MGVNLLFMVFLFLMLLFLALRAKFWLRWQARVTNGLPQDPVPSAFSVAIAELLGIAGGIYLSLIMVVSFLELTIPERIVLWGVAVKPLALLAIVLTLIQPLFSEAFTRIKKGWGN